jgi:hypothetical protein
MSNLLWLLQEQEVALELPVRYLSINWVGASSQACIRMRMATCSNSTPLWTNPALFRGRHGSRLNEGTLN